MEEEETLQQQALPSTATLPIFVSLFLLLYLSGHSLLFRSWKPPTHRHEASSCLISLAHGTPAFFLSLFALHSSPSPSFASANTYFQNIVINYSVAYFSTDLLHFLLFSPSELIFILHHISTLFAFLTCQYVARHGAFAVLVLLAMAESTSLLQNVWTLARLRRWGLVYAWVSPPFCLFYTVVRGVGAPWFAYRMGVAYFGGEADGAVPTWVWACWLGLALVFVPLSLAWISGVWVQVFGSGGGWWRSRGGERKRV